MYLQLRFKLYCKLSFWVIPIHMAAGLRVAVELVQKHQSIFLSHSYSDLLHKVVCCELCIVLGEELTALWLTTAQTQLILETIGVHVSNLHSNKSENNCTYKLHFHLHVTVMDVYRSVRKSDLYFFDFVALSIIVRSCYRPSALTRLYRASLQLLSSIRGHSLFCEVNCLWTVVLALSWPEANLSSIMCHSVVPMVHCTCKSLRNTFFSNTERFKYI